MTLALDTRSAISATNSSASESANPSINSDSAVPAIVQSRIGRRPKRSDRPPQIGANVICIAA